MQESQNIIYQERQEQYKDEIQNLLSNQQLVNPGPGAFETLQKDAMTLTNKDEDASHFIAMEVYRHLFLEIDTTQ